MNPTTLQIKLEPPYQILDTWSDDVKSFATVIHEYCIGIDAIYETSKFITLFHQFSDQEIGQVLTSSEQGTEMPLIRRSNRRAQAALNRHEYALPLVRSGAFMALCSLQENYISNIIRWCIDHNLLDDRLMGKQVTVAIAKNPEKLADKIEEIIEDEIRTVTNLPAWGQIEHLCKILGLQLDDSKCLPISKYKEVFFRRNQHAHSGGKATKTYIKRCSDENCSIANISSGMDLELSPEYFFESADCLQMVGLALGCYVLEKKVANEVNIAAHIINDVAFYCVNLERYTAALSIAEYGVNTLGKRCKDETKRNMMINIAQTHKWLGNSGESINWTKEIDWDNVDFMYKLAKAALLDDVDSFKAILQKELGSASFEDRKPNILEWPVYREMIDDSEVRVMLGLLPKDDSLDFD